MPFQSFLYQYIKHAYIPKFTITSHVIQFLSTITQTSSLGLNTISSPMAYTHSYIPYNCDIMLTHQAYTLTYLFPLSSSHSIQQFHTHNTWTFLVQFTQKYSRTIHVTIHVTISITIHVTIHITIHVTIQFNNFIHTIHERFWSNSHKNIHVLFTLLFMSLFTSLFTSPVKPSGYCSRPLKIVIFSLGSKLLRPISMAISSLIHTKT